MPDGSGQRVVSCRLAARVQSYAPSLNPLLCFQGSHVDREAVLDVRFDQALVGLVDLLDRNHFDIGSDVVLAAEVEHLLGLLDAADQRAGEALAPE